MKRYTKPGIFALIFALLIFMSLSACTPREPVQEPTPSAGGNLFELLSQLPSFMPQSSISPDMTPDTTPGTTDSRIMRSTLYFSTDEGYTVPISVDVQWEDGIAKACLGKLIKNEANRLEFQKQGIVGVIPDGTEIELNLDGGSATVNLKHMPQFSNAEEEQRMFVSIVNTLTEFDTINDVTILMDGKGGRTTNGNAMPTRQGFYRMNIEQPSVATSGSANTITLYFPSNSGSMNIPITRYVQGGTDLYSCISELVSGTSLPNLVNCFPENTIVLSATLEHGILSINMTSDFEAIMDSPGMYELASSSAALTAQSFGSVDEVRFLVNGVEFSPGNEK